MIKPDEKNLLLTLLDLGPDQFTTFTYTELTGFLFGLAITPEEIPTAEWMPVIFDGESPSFASMAQAEELTSTLSTVFLRMRDNFIRNSLVFPFDFDESDTHQVEEVYEWVSGFEEALALREELWDPEEYSTMPEQKKLELFEAVMTLRALIDPEEFGEFFDRIPEEAFEELFPSIDDEEMSREELVIGLLLGSIPRSVLILQNHAELLRGGVRRSSAAKQAQSTGSDERVIHVDFKKKQRIKTEKQTHYTLTITLEDSDPPIWRQVVVPGRASLADLHQIIQHCMGWYNSHMHQFMIDRTAYCPADDGEETLMRTSRPMDEAKFTLQQLEEKIMGGFLYIYDYGDDWLHRITVEKAEQERKENHPVLLSGELACPPEDCGGIPGYMNLRTILSDPQHPDYLETVKWVGENFDPESFSRGQIETINQRLTHYKYL